MAKVSELSDKELDAMITKHEKTLQLLLKEKERRTGKPAAKAVPQAKPAPASTSPIAESENSFQVVIDEEIIAKFDPHKKDEKAASAPDPDDEAANMRLTRVLKLSKDELEQFNKAVENKSKKKN